MSVRVSPPTWVHNAWQHEATLAFNVTGGDYDSDWVALHGFSPWSVTIEGVFNAQVFLLVTNNPQPPDGVTPDPPDVPIARQLIGPDSFTVDEGYRFAKVIMRNWASGTLRSVDIFIRDRGAQN